MTENKFNVGDIVIDDGFIFMSLAKRIPNSYRITDIFPNGFIKCNPIFPNCFEKQFYKIDTKIVAFKKLSEEEHFAWMLEQ